MSEPTRRFMRPYKDGRACLFVDGRLVADLRPSGRAWRVRLFFPCSVQVYRETLCSSERTARAVALELAESLPDGGASD